MSEICKKPQLKPTTQKLTMWNKSSLVPRRSLLHRSLREVWEWVGERLAHDIAKIPLILAQKPLLRFY